MEHKVEITLKHEKKKFLNYIETENSNPQDWRIKQLLDRPDISVKRLLKDLARQGYISIEFQNDGGKVRRMITVLKHIE